jgi:hypothetical protein
MGGGATTGGLSPAVVYLQNIKMQMERMDKEISGLKSLADRQAAQGELLLAHLAELTQRLATGPSMPQAAAPIVSVEPPAAVAVKPAAVKPAETKSLALAPVPAPAPAPDPIPISAPTPAPAVASAEPSFVVEQTVKPVRFGESLTPAPSPTGPAVASAPVMKLPSAPSGMELKLPEDAAAPAPETAKPARKGPVWPI